MIVIRGGGIAGQVLKKELSLKGIASRIEDAAKFPRSKVCGGILQWDSWQYLNFIFSPNVPSKTISHIAHYWYGKKISEHELVRPMVYVPRFELDYFLNEHNGSAGSEVKPDKNILATGVQEEEGDWIGFEAEGDPVNALEMHYGRGLYAGVAPTCLGNSHIAFLIKKSRFNGKNELVGIIRKELRLQIRSKIKGTRAIRYRRSNHPLAIGDAKLTTHPFLGFGMKHAILSAKLMAAAIADGKTGEYDQMHRLAFGRTRWLSAFIEKVFDSPLQNCLEPLLRTKRLHDIIYRLVHS